MVDESEKCPEYAEFFIVKGTKINFAAQESPMTIAVLFSSNSYLKKCVKIDLYPSVVYFSSARLDAPHHFPIFSPLVFKQTCQYWKSNIVNSESPYNDK